ncbi:hypothetical protein POM88_021965 [Heracleum sosnowskyi]|uniref:Uncharacterized protein n=1 Tax=Heracleum sosnowskyi TaxID=360622 RepID=A0AAD8IEE1_9APIA|nr:hypothetical protein POM88_021965 [Heracleum sosnowskyi]
MENHLRHGSAHLLMHSLVIVMTLFLDYARKLKNLDFDLCKLISSKLQRTSSSVLSSKQESSKGIDKPSSYNSRSRSSVKLKDSASTSTESSLSEKSRSQQLAVAHILLLFCMSSTGVKKFKCLTLGSPDFSDLELLPLHIEILLSSQIITFEHDGNWSKALEYYDLQGRSEPIVPASKLSPENSLRREQFSFPLTEDEMRIRKPYKGLIRSLQQLGCTHVLDLYSQGLTSRKGRFQHDFEFTELVLFETNICLILELSIQVSYEAAWHAGNWDFSLLYDGALCGNPSPQIRSDHFNENLHSCLRALQEGDVKDFYLKLKDSKQLSWLSVEWSCILKGSQLHMTLLEPFIAIRRVLLQVLSCTDCTVQHLLESASTLRKGTRLSQAAAALHEFKSLSAGKGITQNNLYLIGRIEEAKLLRAQDVYRLVGKWLSETRSSNSRTILEKYLRHAVTLAEDHMTTEKSPWEDSQTHFHLALYADALFRNCEESLNFNEWHAAMPVKKTRGPTKELEALIRRLKSSSKGDKSDYSIKIQNLQKQLSMYREEAEKLQQDKDNFLSIALEGYKHCLVIEDKYDIRVFALVSLLKKMAIDHPYHTVFQLLALENGVIESKES